MDNTIEQTSSNIQIAIKWLPSTRSNNPIYFQDTQQVLFVDGGRKRVEIQKPNQQPEQENQKPNLKFTLDKIFSPEDTQQKFYEELAMPIVQRVLSGYNGTVIAYGSYSQAKEYVLQGDQSSQVEMGIIPRACADIFNFIQSKPQIQSIVRVSFLDLYKENIRDLLVKSKKDLEIREKKELGFYVENLTSIVVTSKEQILHAIKVGVKNRTMSSNTMNSYQQGHSILQITVEQLDTFSSQPVLKTGVLSFVEVDGEWNMKHCCHGSQQFKEGVLLNQSVTNLGNVLQALANTKTKHVPYRNSKLTKLLQVSLGGNCSTVMFSTVGINSLSYEETLNNLRVLQRAKVVKNKPKVNQKNQKEIIDSFREEYTSICLSSKNSFSIFSVIDEEEQKSLSFIGENKEEAEQELSNSLLKEEYEII